VELIDRRTEGDLYEATARVHRPDGTQVDDVGVVPIAGLKGEAAANARMKAITKAKRRAVLSACGLGMLDESEIEGVQGTVRAERARGPQVLLPAKETEAQAYIRRIEEAAKSGSRSRLDAIRAELEAARQAKSLKATPKEKEAIRDAVAQATEALDRSSKIGIGTYDDDDRRGDHVPE
jgi:hypothetical protein